LRKLPPVPKKKKKKRKEKNLAVERARSLNTPQKSASSRFVSRGKVNDIHAVNKTRLLENANNGHSYKKHRR
jgi:hypothetical protein